MPPSQSTRDLTSEGAMRAFLVVELLRSTGEREFPAQLASVFFWIAAHEGCKQEDLTAECNISPSSVSRSVTWLGPKHRLEHRSGLHLVMRKQDPDNHRAWRLYLTQKGKVFTNLLDNTATSSLSNSIGMAVQAKKSLLTYDKESTVQHQDLGTGT